MATACVEPLTLYRPRDPQASDLWRLLDEHFDSFQQVYDERFQAKYGYWRPIVGQSVGVKRNFQILSPLDFLAEFTQHIPPKGSHLIRYYGWYSNKSRGMRKQAEVEASAKVSSEDDASAAAATRCSQTWAMLIKRVYEVDPLCCPECGGQMKVVSFIEPPQADVIEAILTHCELWQSRSPRAPPDVDELVLELDPAYADNSLDSGDQAESSQELTYVAIDTFLENF